MSTALDLYLLVLSPSTRRAWIEIYGATLENGMVAGRPPPGGRG